VTPSLLTLTVARQQESRTRCAAVPAAMDAGKLYTQLWDEETQHHYYVNRLTGETTWQLPQSAPVARQARPLPTHSLAAKRRAAAQRIQKLFRYVRGCMAMCVLWWCGGVVWRLWRGVVVWGCACVRAARMIATAHSRVVP
jgi:hypothetical protein